MAGHEAWDTLLESLSYLTDGSWPGFERALESIDALSDTAEVSSRDTARTLMALGHIDLKLDPYTLRPEAWSISPPALVRATDGAFVLCGRRPSALLATLNSEAERLGLTVSSEPRSDQPSRVTVLASSDDASWDATLVDALQSAGLEISINRAGAAALASALPTLGDVVSFLRHSTPPPGTQVDVLRLSGNRLTWQQAPDCYEPGAYRFSPPPLVYGYVDSEGAAPARVDARLARLLATLDAGLDAFAWDPESGVASARYYAEPPMLFERALVLCSGYAPSSDPSEPGVTRYPAVSEEVASAIYARLRAHGRDGD